MAPRVSRRRVLSILGMSAAAAAAWRAGIAPRRARLATARASRALMGTLVNITVAGENHRAADAAVSSALDRMAGLEAVLSRHRPDSDLSRLNAAGVLDRPRAPLVDLLRHAREMGEASLGAFDVTVKPLVDLYERAAERRVPSDESVRQALRLVDYRAVDVTAARVRLILRGMAVTLDGIAKGYIVDAGVALLADRGFANVLVEAGGDLLASGEAAAGRPWRVGVRSPRSDGRVLARFEIRDRAAATSGDYMQPYTPDLLRHHILDPRTGTSPPELASVTVLAPSAAAADALSTAIMVMGSDLGLGLAERLPATEALVVGKDLQIRRTGGFPA